MTQTPLHSTHGALRFLTAGSVDDGKSTLIGRLLYDSRALMRDQVDALQRQRRGDAPLDLSLLTDGLEAEREQGITIDVAYRYFATPRRKFIMADAPGHEQYTRNMVTAAAGCHAAVILVDVTKLDLTQRPLALLPQTRRHALLAHRLGVAHLVFAVNKIDAVPDPAAAWTAVRAALQTFASDAGLQPAAILPVSALRGDNVTTPLRAPWYDGPSLLQVLERLPLPTADAASPWRLAVQWVQRTGKGTGEQPRIFWGRLASGVVHVGDAVQVFSSGQHATVVALWHHGGRSVDHAQAGQSVGVVLDHQLDISRGDWLAAPGALDAQRRFAATLAWLDSDAAVVGRRYWLRHGHRWVQGRVATIEHRLDIQTLQPTDAHELGANDIGRVVLETAEALPLQPFAHAGPDGGALIVVDPHTHRTAAAVLVE